MYDCGILFWNRYHFVRYGGNIVFDALREKNSYPLLKIWNIAQFKKN